MPKWNWSDWGSLEVGVNSLCQSAVTLLGRLLEQLTAKRAKIEAPGAEFYKLPDEVGKPFHEAIDILLDITYRIREGMEWRKVAQEGLSKIKNELIPEMRERLEGDAQLEGLLLGVEALCDRANWMVSPWGASSSGAGQADVGGASSDDVSAIWKAVEALRLAKSRLRKAHFESRSAALGAKGKIVNWEATEAIRLAKADYTPRSGEAILAFNEAWAAYDLLRMRLSEISEEDALAWQEAVGSKFKDIFIELGAERLEGRKPDIQAIRTLISQIKDIAEDWRNLLNEKWQMWVDQGKIKIPEIVHRRGELEEYLASLKNKMDGYLTGVVRNCNTFLEITADWVMGEPEDPKEAIPRILEEMGERFESLRHLLGGHSPELIDAEKAFKEWRDAIIGAVTGAKKVTEEEIKRKKDNFINHWQSFEGRMIDHNWFGSTTAMKIAAAIGKLYHDLLDNLFKLELL
jgi:hypothetical protein